MIEQNAMVDALKRLARLKNWNIANAQNSFEELTAARELKAVDLFLHEVGVDVDMFYETDGRVAEVSLNGEKIIDNRDKTTWPSVEIDNQWMKTFRIPIAPTVNGATAHSSTNTSLAGAQKPLLQDVLSHILLKSGKQMVNTPAPSKVTTKKSAVTDSSMK